MIGSDLREPAPARPAGPQPPSAQLSRRERSGRSRMAVVTALYDAAPAARNAADILPIDAGERAARRPGPKASSRKVDASLEHSVAPMVAALFDQAETRDPHHRRRWVCLVDGAGVAVDETPQRLAIAQGGQDPFQHNMIAVPEREPRRVDDEPGRDAARGVTVVLPQDDAAQVVLLDQRAAAPVKASARHGRPTSCPSPSCPG